jgi:hypothetical protein
MQPRYVNQTGTGSSDWQLVNRSVTPIAIGIGCVASGGVNYTVQYTYDDPTGTYLNPVSGTAVPTYAISALTSATTSLDSSITVPIAALRITKNSGTGTVLMTFIQAGIAGP